MARQPMVTRNIKAYDCTVFGVNRETEQTEERLFTVSAKLKTDKAIIKSLTKQDGEFIPLEVKNKNAKATLYGMTENEFIAAAKIMQPRKKQD